MSWRKGARRPVARRKSCRDRIAAATTQSTNHYRSRRATGPSANRDLHALCPVLVQHWRLTTCTLASSVTQPRLQASPAADKTAVPTRKPGFEPALGDPNGFQVHRLNHSATTTPMTNCGPPAPLAAGGQHRTPPSVRLKIQLKDELAKRSPTSPLLDAKAAVTGLLRHKAEC
ncbi:hypothetical protein G5714_024637 [Onychostoma macrolepis]|uniref:Uncharacterized protein n=1 Tax=Onychostoma macrolepis TaxID=369639 RepID=A0A7J6BK88_9TELE|nr:hypothetical protein G5714_024637 [Onychostoma macrolepis]